MPPRLKVTSNSFSPGRKNLKLALCRRCRNATTAAITPAPSISQMSSPPPPISYPRTQPPSHRRPEYRSSQLIRQYVSLLRTTPLILLFQHNNLRATEWVHIRRELATALRKVDDSLAAQTRNNNFTPLAPDIKLQIAKTSMFIPALRIAEYYRPRPDDPSFTHALSPSAYEAVNAPSSQPRLSMSQHHPLSPLLIGPLALLTFPSVSPPHLKAALQILSPSPPLFPAPTRRANPSFHESRVPESVRKLLLLGARVAERTGRERHATEEEGVTEREGRVFDLEGTRWMGGIEGGIDGLRARVVGMLQGGGGGGEVVRALEGVGRGLYLMVEGRRGMLEKEEEEDEKEKEKEGGKE